MIKPSNHIIKNVLNNKATKQEAEIVAKWFATEEGQEYLKGIMDKEHYHTVNDNNDAEFNQNEILHKINTSISNRKKRLTILKIAVVFIPILIASTVLWYINSKVDLFSTAENKAITTHKGEKNQIIFQDGTQVYINPETTVIFPEKFGFNQRTITLNGEAYFNVAKNQSRPFIIKTEKSSVKVLGTSFLITSYKNDKTLTIILDEGKIAFTDKNNNKKELKTGEKLKYNKKTGKIIISKKHELHTYHKNNDKFIAFDNDSLKTVIQTLNRWYNVPFVVKDTTAYKYSFTTSFKNNSLEEVITELQKLSPLVFTITEDDKVMVKLKTSN